MQEFYRVDWITETRTTHQVNILVPVNRPGNFYLVGPAEKSGPMADGESVIVAVTDVPDTVGHLQVLRRFAASEITVHHNTQPEIAYASLAWA